MTTKDVTVEGRNYRLRPFSPVIGSWTLIQLSRMLTDEEVYRRIRANCLDCVDLYVEKADTKLPMRLYDKETDKFLMPGVELDMKETMLLIMEVANFNFDPFMKPGESPKLTAA